MATRQSSSHQSIPADVKFWRDAIYQRGAGRRGRVPIDGYSWAMHVQQLVRKRHNGDVAFEQILGELERAWKEHGGPPGLTWRKAKAALSDSWQRADALQADSIAHHGGFKEPPTFSKQGGLVPRNIDEPNL